MGKKLKKKDFEINFQRIQNFFKFNVKSKKGVFFTALLVLMSSVLLTLAVLLFQNSLESESRFVELSNLDTVHNLYRSIEESILNIFLYETGRNYISVSNNQDSPEDPQWLQYIWDLDITEFEQIELSLFLFEQFVEENYNFIILDISASYPALSIIIDVNPPGIGVRKGIILLFN